MPEAICFSVCLPVAVNPCLRFCDVGPTKIVEKDGGVVFCCSDPPMRDEGYTKI
jgi:hypothetical protein